MHHFWILPAAENHMLIWRRSSLLHRVTRSGVHYDNAMEHLKSLRLPESIEESGANAMGDVIRSRLRVVYKIDHAKPCVMTISDDDEDAMSYGDGQGSAESDQEGGSDSQDDMRGPWYGFH